MSDLRVHDAPGTECDLSLPCSHCPFQDFSLCGQLRGKPGLVAGFEAVKARRKLCREGDPAEYVFTLCEGWAFRFTMLADGRRQILDFLLPGQLVSTSAPFKDLHDASVQTLTGARFALLPRQALLQRMQEQDDLLLRVTELCVSDLDWLESCLADLGRRSALERVARLLLSLYERMESRGRVDDSGIEFPVRQEHIADAVGLTPIHVGRMLRQLRESGMIRLRGRRLQLLDRPALERIAEVQP